LAEAVCIIEFEQKRTAVKFLQTAVDD